MYRFVVLIALAAGLAVLLQVLNEVLPGRLPRALTTTGSVAIAALVCWALDYSVFTAFHQPLRESWMNPVASGVTLVGVGEVLRAVGTRLDQVLRGRGPAHA
jgi:hypothetical protein